MPPDYDIAVYAQCELPTEYGVFQLRTYRNSSEQAGLEHAALVMGDVSGSTGVLARIHSECMTGEVFHSLRCDCREQLELAFERVQEAGAGVILYLRQEGRGIGLGDKIRAYGLQDQGQDTVDANRSLGFDDDLRDYGMVAPILADLGIASIRLLTNNPAKVNALRETGVEIIERLPHLAPAHEMNRAYLDTKRIRMGHIYGADPDA